MRGPAPTIRALPAQAGRYPGQPAAHGPAGAPVSTRASFAVEAGRPGLHQTADNPPVGIRFVPDVASPLDHLAEQSAR
ncbi:hypothetical protein ACIBKY_52815 [Nonomuraea sp. NPDC050394]|uniref:hypothetical protein n=1 Tax=Nonomuraea sp. NPDC050394 TaxID=3364363 RepID=UPI0037A62AEB